MMGDGAGVPVPVPVVPTGGVGNRGVAAHGAPPPLRVPTSGLPAGPLSFLAGRPLGLFCWGRTGWKVRWAGAVAFFLFLWAEVWAESESRHGSGSGSCPVCLYTPVNIFSCSSDAARFLAAAMLQEDMIGIESRNLIAPFSVLKP